MHLSLRYRRSRNHRTDQNDGRDSAILSVIRPLRCGAMMVLLPQGRSPLFLGSVVVFALFAPRKQGSGHE